MTSKINKNFNFLIKKYLSVKYSSYSFLIYNCLSCHPNSICLDFFENYFSDCGFDNGNYLFCNKNNKFSRESIDGINEFRKKTNFHNDETYKFIIISDIDCIDLLYLNMLLKIIEESDNKIVFFLFANNGFNVLKSLKSRCFLVDYNILQDKIHDINHAIFSCNFEEIINLIQTNDNEVDTINFIHKYYIYYLYNTIIYINKNSEEDKCSVLNDACKLEFFLKNLDEIEQDILNNKIHFSNYKSFLLDFLTNHHAY